MPLSMGKCWVADRASWPGLGRGHRTIGISSHPSRDTAGTNRSVLKIYRRLKTGRAHQTPAAANRGLVFVRPRLTPNPIALALWKERVPSASDSSIATIVRLMEDGVRGLDYRCARSRREAPIRLSNLVFPLHGPTQSDGSRTAWFQAYLRGKAIPPVWRSLLNGKSTHHGWLGLLFRWARCTRQGVDAVWPWR